MLKRFLVTFLPLSVLLAGFLAYIHISETRSSQVSLETKEAAHTALQFKTISSTLSNIATDLIILSELHEFIDIIEGREKDSKKRSIDDLISFSEKKGVYDQIRFLNEKGMEDIRINYNKGNPTMVSKEKLQFKGDRYYFKETIKLKKGEIFLSAFDLNIEKGKVERPLKPVIRFGTPIIDSQGRKRGIMLINFLGTLLIKNFKAVSINTSGHDMLVNSNGYWLISQKPEEEWGFMFKDRKDKTFQDSFPDAWQKISREESGQFLTSNGLFSFISVYPLLEIMKSAVAFQQFSGNEVSIQGAEKGYYWKIVSLVPPDILNQRSHNLMLILQRFYGVMILVFGIASWYLAKNWTKRKQAEEVLFSKTKLIELLKEIAVTANEASTADEAIQVCLDKVCAYMGWPIGHAYQTDSMGKLIPSKLWHLENPQQFESFRKVTEVSTFDPGIGLPGRVLVHGKPAWIPDVTKDPNFPRANLAQDIGVKAGFALPILEGKKVVAVLEFFSDETIEPDGPSLEALSNLATQLGRVTERKRAEEDMKELNRSLEKYANEMELLAEDRAQQLIHADRMASIGTMSAGIAHEINNPTTFIRGNANTLKTFWNKYMKDIIKRAAGEEGDLKKKLNFVLQEMPEMIDEIENGTHRIKKIVDGLKSFSRKEESSFAPESICKCIEDSLKLSKFDTALKHEVVIELNLPKNIPNVILNKQEIEQVFINLFVNAGHAMEVIKNARKRIIKVSTTHVNDEIIIEMTDNGCGMDEKTLNNIFDPFYTTKDTGRGTGLGLSICHGIIEKHRGTISATSSLGEGTTFKITLPLDPTNKDRRTKQSEKISGRLRKDDSLFI